MRLLVYGENSREAVQSLVEIANFYTQQNHPESSLRHLNKAHQTSKGILLSADDSMRLGLETACAYMAIKTPNRAESAKNLINAEKSLIPHAHTLSEDSLLCYRRDTVIADILFKKQKYVESLEFFDHAIFLFEDSHEGTKTQELAELYIVAAQAAKKGEQASKALQYYQSAHALYLELKMDENAKKIEEIIQRAPQQPVQEDPNLAPKAE